MGAPIFIAGMMQSGTSLLRKLLGSHPRIFAGLETHWCGEEFQNEWRNPNARRMRWTREFFEVDESSWNALIAASDDATDFVGRLLSWCAGRAGKPRWADKTPDNILYARTIWKKWPDSPLLYSDRDPRDCFASWKINKKLPIETFVEKWNMHQDALDSLTAEESSKVLRVRYEDVVRRTESVLAEVCEFIKEDFFPPMASYRGDSSEHAKVLAVAGVNSATADALSRPIFDESIGRWKRDLSEEEVVRIEHLTAA